VNLSAEKRQLALGVDRSVEERQPALGVGRRGTCSSGGLLVERRPNPFTEMGLRFILIICSSDFLGPPGPCEEIMSDLLRELEQERLRQDLPKFAPGDTVRVLYRVREGEKERIQAFEGVCISRRGGGISETFTVRKISSGVGVERIFPLHAPTVKGVEVVRRGRVRRAKLYYLRGLRGKAARIQEKRTH